MTISNVIHVRSVQLDPTKVVLQLNELKAQGVPETLVMSLHGRFVGTIAPYVEAEHSVHLTNTETLTLLDAVGKVYGRDENETLKLRAGVGGVDVLVIVLSSAKSYDLQQRAVMAYSKTNPLPAPGAGESITLEEAFSKLDSER